MDTPVQNTKTIRGDLLISFAMLMFGAYSLFIDLLPQIPIISFLFAIQVVGAIGFFFLARRKKFPTTTTKAKWLLLALAVTTTGCDLSYFWAFRLTSVANATVAH